VRPQTLRERVPGVLQTDDGRLLTRNLVPGERVGEEDLPRIDGVEYRAWDARRSKVAAYLLKGGRTIPAKPGSSVLYLGAANGATASHVSDIVGERGRVVCVEFSARAMRDLVQVCQRRGNMLPIMADAAQPRRYERLVPPVDGIVMDIAQRDQAGIFAKNAARFPAQLGLLAVKARSVDVAADPRNVYEQVIAQVQAQGHRLVERVDLAPFERDHAALLFELARPAGGR
jgi:fibrillarin-like pre-rRNA processing protein